MQIQDEVRASRVLTSTIEKLSSATELTQLTRIVAAAARTIANADGATFVLRDKDLCYYADEDAISPLWKGKRFPMSACISGWAMLNRKTVYIEDIYQDPRIPHDAYRPTFVKSLCMMPIRTASPIGAIGCYWSSHYTPTEHEIRRLQALANNTAIALENLELRKSVLEGDSRNKNLESSQQKLELAIQSIVHDLRNPISAMLAFSSLLENHFSDDSASFKTDERAKQYFTSLFASGLRANQMLSQILSFYKVAHRKLSKQLVDMEIIGRELEMQLRTINPNRSVEFKFDGDMIGYAGPIMIRLVIENLISNAFKYSQHKTNTLIHFGKSENTDKFNTFFVKDNGVGFDPQYTHKLFTPMVRLHDETEFEGTGLGLASVAQIINSHGGEVRAEGQVDKGATFYFSLPALKTA